MFLDDPKTRKAAGKWVLIIFALCCCIFLALSHLGDVGGAIAFVVNLLNPLMIGLGLAVVINVPMTFIEQHLFAKTKKKALQKLRHPLAVLLSVLLMLVCVALPQKLYPDPRYLHLDLWSHLTFTHTFFRVPYQYSQINGVLWTVVIEMQMYLLWPLVGRCAQKKPVPTMLVMAAVAWLYRAVVYYRVEDTAMFQMRQRILDLLSGLSEADQNLLTLRFGLEGGRPMTPEETGRKLGLTPEEVVTREAAALAQLRQG